MQLIFIFSGVILMFLALIQLALDVITIVSSGRVSFQLFGQAWYNLFPAGIRQTQNFIEHYLWAPLWDPALLWVTKQPSVLVLFISGAGIIVLNFIFQKRKEKMSTGFY